MVFFVLAFAVSQVLRVCLLSRCSRFQLCPRDCSPRGSSPWTLQARALEWVTRPSSRGPSRPRDRIRVSTPPAWAGGFFTTGAPCEAPSARPQSNPHAEVACFEMRILSSFTAYSRHNYFFNHLLISGSAGPSLPCTAFH